MWHGFTPPFACGVSVYFISLYVHILNKIRRWKCVPFGNPNRFKSWREGQKNLGLFSTECWTQLLLESRVTCTVWSVRICSKTFWLLLVISLPLIKTLAFSSYESSRTSAWSKSWLLFLAQLISPTINQRGFWRAVCTAQRHFLWWL